jgi:hypothetical protein
MSERHGPLWRAENAARVQAKKAADRKQQERQQHEDNVEIVRALNRVASEQKASRRQEHTYEKKKAIRECLTIIAISLTAIIALITIVVAHRDTMHALKEARNATNTQHTDTTTAIGLAAEANKTARETASAQIREMSAQTEAMKLQAQLIQTQLTPRLEMALDFGDPMSVNGVPSRSITPHWTNNGPTEAINWTGWDGVGIFFDGPPDAKDLVEGKLHLPGVAVAKQIFQESLFIREDSVKAAANGSGVIIFWGYAQWHDRFDHTPLHYKKYCYRLAPVQTNTGAVVWTLPQHYKTECDQSGDK